MREEYQYASIKQHIVYRVQHLYGAGDITIDYGSDHKPLQFVFKL